MSRLKFAANISTMFKEKELLIDRYKAAKEAGFKAVEMQFPYECDIKSIAKARELAGVEQVLINAYPGDGPNADGLAAQPNKNGDFLDSLKLSIDYAKALNCSKIHIMAGSMLEEGDTTYEQTYVERLTQASVLLAKEGIMGLIEPLCPQVKPKYFLQSYNQAKEVVLKVGSPHLKLQLDLYHLQRISGNLFENIESLMPLVGHIQISQVPARHEPNSHGELDYVSLLSLIEKLGYQDWIGLEYFPAGNTLEGLSWIKDYGYKL